VVIIQACCACAVGVQERTRVPGARALEVDRRVATEIMARAARGQRPLMRAPAKLRGLQALGDEPFDRPGVDELPRGLGVRARWVSRSAMWMPLDAEACARSAHSARRARLGYVDLRSAAKFTSACFTIHDTMRGWRHSS